MEDYSDVFTGVETRKATQKMIDCATEIVDTLDVDPPDYNSFSETSSFIDEYVMDYYDVQWAAEPDRWHDGDY